MNTRFLSGTPLSNTEKEMQIVPGFQHRSRFYRAWQESENPQNEAVICAAMYLLSADTFLWGRSRMAIRSDFIDFSTIQIHGMEIS